MDVQVFRAINIGWSNPVFNILFAALSYSGLGVAAAFAAILLVWQKSTRIYAFAIGLSAFIGGTAIAQSLKSMIPRDRPSRQTYAIVQEKIYYSSFPSGHTSTAFAIATAVAILAFRNDKRPLGILMFIWALGVGISRIYRGVHWPTDVAGGACAGVLGGCLAILIIDGIAKLKKKA